ncbi:AarF/ABC1/UbiB kinase family protein [Candidatus Woesearchaeota archaeon]|nr:AarF/ABC1/UbiB kinase family protein [Candidatus Woesearchaeota archaeon]
MFNIPRKFRGIKRFEQVLHVLTKYELGHYLERAGLKKKSLRLRRGMTRPVELRLIFEELGGSFVKLGQLLSLRPDLIPKEFCDELSKLQDEVEPFHYEEVEHVISYELKKPISKLFKSFEKKPLASASIGQVHVARLKNNKKVAVKVMRPGIRALVQTDLEILEYLSRVFKHHMKQKIVDPEEIFAEFKRYSENELDFLKEAANIKVFSNNFKSQPKVIIPEVYSELTTQKVITMGFIEGVELRKLMQKPEHYPSANRKEVAQLVVQSIFQQIFIDGFFHADPHPGNIVVCNAGTGKSSIGFIDFGIVGRLSNELKEKLGLLFINLISRDVHGVVSSLISLNMVDSIVDVEELQKDIRDALGGYYDTAIDKVDFADLFFRSIRVAKKHRIKLPADMVLLGKAMVTLQGVCLALDPEFNIVHESKPFISRLVKKKTSPSYVLKRLARETGRFAEFVQSLPDESQKIYGTFQKADVALDSINADIQGLTRELRVEGGRIVMGMIIAALLIGASMTYSTEPGLGKLFIALAFCILVYLIASIVGGNFRRKASSLQ